MQYCFGHGLSYTEFAYSDLAVEKQENAAEFYVNVSCIVKNTGNRTGKETVQLYVSDRTGKTEKPVKELKGYEKVDLAPGESRRVNIRLSRKDFAYFDEAAGDFAVNAGEYGILVGASLQDVRLIGRVTV